MSNDLITVPFDREFFCKIGYGLLYLKTSNVIYFDNQTFIVALVAA